MRKKLYYVTKLVGCIFVATLLTGCSLEDLGFEIEYDDTNSSSYSSGTGLNITESKYNRIKNGDSYSKVKCILGGACDNYYSSDDEDWYIKIL